MNKKENEEVRYLGEKAVSGITNIPGCRDGVPHIGPTSTPPFWGEQPRTGKPLYHLRLPGPPGPRISTNTTLPYQLYAFPKRPYFTYRWGV